jgi:penicillin-binding protein 1A
MNAEREGSPGWFGRIVAALRRHPFWAIAALPLALAAYVVVLIPFTPSIGDIKKAKQEQPSVVLSADGKELAVFRRANRDWVKLSDISPKVVQALLATEDKRFYDHPGIDVVRTAKAAINTVFHGDREGGSTITQQLARNLYPEQIGRAPTLTRKIKEAITALKIESVYSKDEILETYLNSVSFLYNAWGIEMAARTYFDKPAKDLNELEAATLVGMLKGTAYYNPVMNPDRARERRNTVLAMMVKDGKLQEARYEQLKDQPLRLDFSKLQDDNGPAPYLAEYLRRWLLQWADEHDYNIYADGLVVKTTIDSRLQQMADQAVQRQIKGLQAVADVEWSRSGSPSLGTDPQAYVAAHGKSQPFEYFWNSNRDLVHTWIRESAEYKGLRDAGKNDADAMQQLEHDTAFMADLRKQKTLLETGFLAIEPQTGAIKAWVGGRDFNLDKFDHVQQARRQPGSTFKPFVYGAAFEMGHSPDETLMDQPVAIQIDKHQVWRPGDIEGAPTNQPMSLRDGLAKSKNTITAQLMMQVGPSRVASLARALGVRQSKLDEVPSLALGTSPVTLKEMVTAFSSIANGGNYIEPQLVTAVEDRDHNVLETFMAPASEPALANQADQTLVDVMRGVIDYGTAVGLRQRFQLTGDLAGKTGTTQDNTDGWFILMHPQLVAGAWVGFNDARVTMRSSYWGQGAHNALLEVGDFMQQSEKAGLVDPKATFAAPHLQPQPQDASVAQKMGDWWNSLFNTAPPSANDTPVVAGSDYQLPKLEPAPSSITVPAPQPLPYPAPAVNPDAPVIVDSGRVPSYPRATEPVPPTATIPGTQVYRSPDATMPAAPPPPTTTLGAGASNALPPSSRSNGAVTGDSYGTHGDTGHARSETASPRSASSGYSGETQARSSDASGSRDDTSWMRSDSTRDDTSRSDAVRNDTGRVDTSRSESASSSTSTLGSSSTSAAATTRRDTVDTGSTNSSSSADSIGQATGSATAIQ